MYIARDAYPTILKHSHTYNNNDQC